MISKRCILLPLDNSSCFEKLSESDSESDCCKGKYPERDNQIEMDAMKNELRGSIAVKLNDYFSEYMQPTASF